ncbi:hypothetical protein M6D93_04135 [Jatrophihabitans telluris]|uniref:Uncharacterized protein n=1 Tax=Jatrophihabitans telluris TaxID=2038343 RepID=A0ABY4R086_9ACTN|nr:hypothetical protein [Jatrophihabitans telluris]UQX89198.1 hypothetical protein M6D93_04135 [Jatrophihabitans telluris]
MADHAALDKGSDGELIVGVAGIRDQTNTMTTHAARGEVRLIEGDPTQQERSST